MSAPNKPPPPIVWWVIWSAMLIGVFVMYFTTPADLKVPTPSVLWMVALAPFLISSILRWLFLTRIQSSQTAFPLFIVGIGLAESTCIMGLFVFSAHSADLFALSVLGMVQYVPYFAGSFEKE